MTRVAEPVAEEVVRLVVNGRPAAVWSCTPAALEALAAGRLLALGFIRSPDDILELRHDRDGRGLLLDTRVPPPRMDGALEEREHRRQHGCGLRYLVDCAPSPLRADTGPAVPPGLEPFPTLFRALFERSPSRRTTGGHHTAALSDGTRLLHLHEEVGRHNAADKAIGAALLDRQPLTSLGLVTTARISGEMAEKGARAGLAWIASRSVPTTLAVEIAAAAGMTLIARAASPEAAVLRATPMEAE